ncbi:hypothetical protein ACB098_05G053800 [Castanea mollissima]
MVNLTRINIHKKVNKIIAVDFQVTKKDNRMKHEIKHTVTFERTDSRKYYAEHTNIKTMALTTLSKCFSLVLPLQLSGRLPTVSLENPQKIYKNRILEIHLN